MGFPRIPFLHPFLTKMEFFYRNRVFGVSILNLKVKDGNSKNQKMDPNLSNGR